MKRVWQRRWLRRSAALALGLLFFWIVGLTLLTALQRRVLFPRHLVHASPRAGEGVAGLERWWLETDVGRVEAWLLLGNGVSAQRPGPAVIFAHGNGELIDDWPEQLEPYRRHGITVLLPEYRGYGRSAGSPSQQALTDDLIRFRDRLAARPEVDAERISYHGRSLGGGVVCALAAQRPPAALILMSTFSSVRAAASDYWVPGFLVADPFDNASVLSRYRGPVLIIHGLADRVVPARHAELLRQAAPQAHVVLYPRVGHNDCPPRWEPFWSEVWSLLRKA